MSLTNIKKSAIAPLGYAYSKYSLANGIKLIQIEQNHLHRASISVCFRAGSRYETPDDNGLSHFLEHMVFRGTENYRSSYELNLAVESLGGTLYAATSPDSTEFGITLPPESLAEGIRILAEIVHFPLFQDIEIERQVIAEEIREELDEHEAPIDIDYLSRRKLWPNEPLGQSITGPLENALRFTEDDVRRHLARCYVGSNAIVCLSGSYDKSSISRVVEESFSNLAQGVKQPILNTPVLGNGPTTFYHHRPGSQTHLRLAFHAPGATDPDEVPLAILLGILDDGMSTRLHQRIFDELGLAYNIGADAEVYSDVGALNIDATASHTRIVEIVKQILDITNNLKNEPVSNEELEKAKKREIWALKSFLDDTHAMSTWYGEQELHWEPMPLAARIKCVSAITSEDVIRVAKRVFCSKNLHVTLVGVQDKKRLAAIDKTIEKSF